MRNFLNMFPRIIFCQIDTTNSFRTLEMIQGMTKNLTSGIFVPLNSKLGGQVEKMGKNWSKFDPF